MQRDGRSLDPGTLETIRLMAVERVQEGERDSVVITSYTFIDLPFTRGSR